MTSAELYEIEFSKFLSIIYQLESMRSLLSFLASVHQIATSQSHDDFFLSFRVMFNLFSDNELHIGVLAILLSKLMSFHQHILSLKANTTRLSELLTFTSGIDFSSTLSRMEKLNIFISETVLFLTYSHLFVFLHNPSLLSRDVAAQAPALASFKSEFVAKFSNPLHECKELSEMCGHFFNSINLLL
ncbi:hypothetical protein GEMRC1_010629 [Eukaryota sp. GEM-RC1]